MEWKYAAQHIVIPAVKHEVTLLELHDALVRFRGQRSRKIVWLSALQRSLPESSSMPMYFLKHGKSESAEFRKQVENVISKLCVFYRGNVKRVFPRAFYHCWPKISDRVEKYNVARSQAVAMALAHQRENAFVQITSPKYPYFIGSAKIIEIHPMSISVIRCYNKEVQIFWFSNDNCFSQSQTNFKLSLAHNVLVIEKARKILLSITTLSNCVINICMQYVPLFP